MSSKFYGNWSEDERSAVEAALFVSGNKDSWGWYKDAPDLLYGQRVGYDLPTVFGHDISEFIAAICEQCRIIEYEARR